jgi:hypothetical protein
LQDPEEHCARYVADVEEGEAEREFGWRVPVEDQGDDAGPEAGGEEAEEEAQGVDCVGVGGEVGAVGGLLVSGWVEGIGLGGSRGAD